MTCVSFLFSYEINKNDADPQSIHGGPIYSFIDPRPSSKLENLLIHPVLLSFSRSIFFGICYWRSSAHNDCFVRRRTSVQSRVPRRVIFWFNGWNAVLFTGVKYKWWWA